MGKSFPRYCITLGTFLLAFAGLQSISDSLRPREFLPPPPAQTFHPVRYAPPPPESFPEHMARTRLYQRQISHLTRILHDRMEQERRYHFQDHGPVLPRDRDVPPPEPETPPAQEEPGAEPVPAHELPAREEPEPSRQPPEKPEINASYGTSWFEPFTTEAWVFTNFATEDSEQFFRDFNLADPYLEDEPLADDLRMAPSPETRPKDLYPA